MSTLYDNTKENEFSDVVFDLAPFPMWIYDLDSLKFLAVNKEAIKHYGYSRKEFLAMTIKDIRPAADIPKLLKSIAEARSRTELYKESLFKHRLKDGNIIRVQIKSNLITYRGRKAEIVTAVDLTASYLKKKQREEQGEYLATLSQLNEILLKSENWKEGLQQCLPILGSFLGADRISFFQPRCPSSFIEPELSWHKRNAEIKKQIIPLQPTAGEIDTFIHLLSKKKVIHAKVSEMDEGILKKTLSKEKVYSLLSIAVKANKRVFGYIRVDTCNKNRSWHKNDVHLLKNLVHNLEPVINESFAHQQLVDSEAKFRSLVQNGKDLIAIIDAEGNYKYVAPTSLNVLGIPPEKFLGRNAFEFINGEDLQRLQASLKDLAQNQHISIEPYRFLDNSNTWRWIQTDLFNHLEDPTIEGIIANSRDVTSEMEKRLGDQLLVRMTKMICQPGSLSDCFEQALQQLIGPTKINIGEAWMLSTDKSQLFLLAKSCQNSIYKQFYEKKDQVDTLSLGQGLAGQVWKEQKFIIWEDIHQCSMFSHTRQAKNTGLQSALGVPIIYNEEFLGCIICFTKYEKRAFSDQEKFISNIGGQIGSVVKQKMVEEEYRNFFNIAPDPLCILGTDLSLQKYNQAFYKLLGYEEQELLNQSMENFIAADDKKKFDKILELKTAQAQTVTFEGRLLTKQGDLKWLIWKGSHLPAEKSFILAAKDITEQKHAEQKLTKAYDRLKNAQKIAKLGYWFRNLDSNLSHWSEEVYAIYGVKPTSFVPTLQNIAQTFHPEDRYLLIQDPREFLVPEKITRFENRIVTSSKKEKWVHQELRLLMNEKQQPYRIEGIIQDITEKKEYELQLTQSNERFRLAMKASNEMIYEIDLIKNRVTRSKGYSETFCYETDETFTKHNSWFSSIHPEDTAGVWQSLCDSLENQDTTFWKRDYRVINEDGKTNYLIDRCFIVRNAQGNPIRCVGSALDITASKQQLERIKKQNKKLRDIAWAQSHVIRAPLSRIMGLIYLTKEHEAGGKTLQEIFELISDSAEELDSEIKKIITKTETLKEDDHSNPTY